MTVEVTYTGKLVSPLVGLDASFEQHQTPYALIVSAEESLRESASRLAWMKSLESFVLIKLGSSAAFAPGQRVDSPFLHILVHGYLFPRLEENPLRRFWVQDFEVNLCAEGFGKL